MIPMKLHYCWFGRNPKPPIIEKYMSSWRPMLPDYEFVEWNEDNFDIDISRFTRAAYDAKAWAFVTDYVRLWALYHYGGIYTDCDVEFLKPLDRFLGHRAFTGHEIDKPGEMLMVTAVLGAEPGHPWIKMLLDYYRDAVFELVPNTQIITRLSLPWVERVENGFRYLREGVVIYPPEYLCPFEFRGWHPTPTEKSCAIHHYAASWLGKPQV